MSKKVPNSYEITDLDKASNIINSLLIILKGFAMGIADIIPGVSGGTIAFITGVYDDLLASVSSVNGELIKKIFKFQIKEVFDHINIKFLFPLLTGIVLAILSMSKLVHYCLENYATQTWALFFGLIAASIIYIGKAIKDKGDYKNIISLLIFSIVAHLIVNLIPIETPNTLPYIFGSAMIAICAMILPGISGSFILVILGKYLFITSALKNPFSTESLQVIVVFILGSVVGITSFSKILKHLLHKYHDLTMSALTGFMLGSMSKIWPFRNILETKQVGKKLIVLKESLYFPSEFTNIVLISFILMLFGFALVFILEKLASKK